MPDFDLAELHAALDAQRKARGLTWAEVMREISGRKLGPHPMASSTVTGLRTTRVAEADGVLQMLRWLRRSPESFLPGFNATRAHDLPEAPAHAVLRFDTVKLYDALNAQRAGLGLTWKQVAAQIGGLSPASLTHLSQGGRTAFPMVVEIAAWLGRPTADFVRISDR